MKYTLRRYRIQLRPLELQIAQSYEPRRENLQQYNWNLTGNQASFTNASLGISPSFTSDYLLGWGWRTTILPGWQKCPAGWLYAIRNCSLVQIGSDGSDGQICSAHTQGQSSSWSLLLKSLVNSNPTHTHTHTRLSIQEKNRLEEMNISKNRSHFISWEKQLCENYLPCTIKL